MAQLSLANTKGKPQIAFDFTPFFYPITCVNTSTFSHLENLSQVSSERDSSSTRIAELEAQVLSLRKEVDEAKKETAAALTRAERAESKEEAANKQEEELTP